MQPLQHRWVPQPCPLPQGCSLGEEAWDAEDEGSKERGAQKTHSPSEEEHEAHSTHRHLTEPIHVQATCSAAVLPPPSPPLHQPVAIGCCHHRRGQKAIKGLLQNSQRPSPSAAQGVGKGQCAPHQHTTPARATAACPQPRHSISAGLGEDMLKDNASPKPAAHQGCGSRAGRRKGSPAVSPPCPNAPRRALLGAKAQPE